MTIIGTAIVAACVGAQGGYNEACTKALDAGTRQAGIYQDVSQVEKGYTSYLSNKAENAIGKSGIAVLGAGIFLYKVSKDRSISFNLPNLGICSSIDNQVTLGSYTLHMKWDF